MLPNNYTTLPPHDCHVARVHVCQRRDIMCTSLQVREKSRALSRASSAQCPATRAHLSPPKTSLFGYPRRRRTPTTRWAFFVVFLILFVLHHDAVVCCVYVKAVCCAKRCHINIPYLFKSCPTRVMMVVVVIPHTIGERSRR